jgi:hypothetical protein
VISSGEQVHFHHLWTISGRSTPYGTATGPKGRLHPSTPGLGSSTRCCRGAPRALHGYATAPIRSPVRTCLRLHNRPGQDRAPQYQCREMPPAEVTATRADLARPRPRPVPLSWPGAGCVRCAAGSLGDPRPLRSEKQGVSRMKR